MEILQDFEITKQKRCGMDLEKFATMNLGVVTRVVTRQF